MARQVLKPEELYKKCDPEQFAFKSTNELEQVESVIGQDRAVEALRFGIGIRQDGYNLFALGPCQIGKASIIQDFVREQATSEPVPSDYVYVNNFRDPQKPNALELPPGQGVVFQKDMAQLVEELRADVPKALESDEYLARLQEIEETLETRQTSAFEALQKEASEHDIAMLRTPTGFVFAPMKDGKVIKPEGFEKLSTEDQQKIEKQVESLQEKLAQLIKEAPKWRRATQDEVKQLNRDVIMAVVGQLIDEIRTKYSGDEEVLDYLGQVQQDVIDHADQFRRTDDNEPAIPAMMAAENEIRNSVLNRYRVNLLIDHSDTRGAPVIVADNPAYPSLVGRVEHQAQMGALVTDFTMIRAGAMHQANGGYLVIDARKLLMQPYAWEGLKRVLQSQEVKIESLGQMMNLISTVSLEPEPIPLDVKVVLLGERFIYYLLAQNDPEFGELFKVAVDFDDTVVRNGDHDRQYAGFIATLVHKDNLLAMDAAAVARVIEASSRMVGDAEKLSSRFGRISDLLRETDYWARQAGRDSVQVEDVQKAIDSANHRQSRIQERLQEETIRGTLLIDTSGTQVGQINALSVMQLGDYAFGHPSRVTARVRLGKGEVVDIEREVKLGGPIHSKGVLILKGFLSGRYCQDMPLSMSASLVFEQAYGGIDGDSASSAELYALLSALSGVPIRQDFAVTGSVNQFGQVQPIGGVNEKIEGFFDICNSRGLDGNQGVMIPASNVKHLMLKKEVVDAVDDGKFQVVAVETIDEGMEVLMDGTAGERGEDGQYPEGTLNARVEARLRDMANRIIDLAAKKRHEHEDEKTEGTKD